MKVVREELLKVLEFVKPGLSPKELIEQSSCFVFQEGKVFSYNDEVSCSMKCPLDITGAVPAAQFLELLDKLKDDELDIAPTNGELIIKGTREESGLRMEKEVLLPLSAMEQCEKWNKLPSGFTEAIELVQQCCSKDENRFAITCVNIHPEWIEAADDFQMTRYKIKTGIENRILVRQVAIKEVPKAGMTRFGQTKSWMHFKNKDGLILSCRKYPDDYPNLSSILKIKGNKAKLPKGLADAIPKAEIFSSTNPDNDLVKVHLRPKKWRLTGIGTMGRYKKWGKTTYDGEPITFLISPKLLTEIVKRHREVEISEERLIARGDNWTFVSCLSKVPESED